MIGRAKERISITSSERDQALGGGSAGGLVLAAGRTPAASEWSGLEPTTERAKRYAARRPQREGRSRKWLSRCALTLVLALELPAAADDPGKSPARGKLVALAAAPDAAHAVAIGPAGEAYLPDGHAGWVRTRAIGIAAAVTGATHAGATAIAATARAPFRLVADGWTAIHLGRDVAPIVGAGSRATAAVGKTIYAIDSVEPVKLADAQEPVLALAASPTAIVIATASGLSRLTKTTWKPIASAPTTIVAFASERWAIVDHGVFDLDRGKLIALPATPRVTAVLGDALLAVIASELVTVRATKLDREPLPFDASAVVGLAADRARIVVALADGHLAVRDKATWTTTEVRDDLPAPHPGSPPATSPPAPTPR